MRYRYFWSFALILFAIIASAQDSKGLKSPSTKATSNEKQELGGINLDFKNPKNLKLLINLRNAAILDLTAALEKNDVNAGEHDDFVEFAAKMLGELRSDDQASLKSLCRNVKLRSMTRSNNGPLDGFVAAESLVKIGGPNVVEAIFDELRGALDYQTLITFAFVLHSLDTQEVTNTRLTRAIDQETKHPLFPSGPDREYLSNLKQLEKWVEQRGFFEDLANWPSTVMRKPRTEK